MKDITLTMECPFCHKEHSVEVFESEYNAYENGALAQEAFKSLTPTEREQIISFLCPECQEKIFGES